MPSALRFSADPAELDRDLVFHWLSDLSYWASGRPRAVFDASLAGSRVYSVYDAADGRQLAFARVVTDGATFGWLCDVFVAEEARGRGVGKALLAGILAELDPLGVRRIALRTADAHGLYAAFGFELLDEPEMWMTRSLP